jgi:hypothetical protein
VLSVTVLPEDILKTYKVPVEESKEKRVLDRYNAGGNGADAFKYSAVIYLGSLDGQTGIMALVQYSSVTQHGGVWQHRVG